MVMSCLLDQCDELFRNQCPKCADEIYRLRARVAELVRERSIVYYVLVEARRELEAYEETMTGERYNSTKINDAIILLEEVEEAVCGVI